MKRVVLTIMAALFSWISATPGAQTPATVAFVNVTAIPMDSDRALGNQTVVTSNGRITAVGPTASTTAPAGAIIVDGRGKFLLPGLAEMHGHLPDPMTERQYAEDVLFLYVAAGVTTVRGMLGTPGQIEMRNQVNRGEVVGPTVYVAGPAFSDDTIKTPQEAIARVRQQKAEGWNLLKIFPGLSRESYDAVARTAKELRIPFSGHVPPAVGIEHAIASGQETVDHMDGYLEALDGMSAPIDPRRLQALIAQTKAAGTWVVPTMFVWETFFGPITLESRTTLPELQYLPRALVGSWTTMLRTRLQSQRYNRATATQFIANRMQVLETMHDKGVRILLGTDAPQQFNVPGFSIHHETRRMVDAGLTPYQVLRTGTVTVGEYYAADDRVGTIAVGQRADLILADANPLQEVTNAGRHSGVMVRGRWLPKSTIQARLEQIAARYTQ